MADASPPGTRRVSIVVTCYNFRSYIAATLESLAGQTHGDFEAIVVDNNSTDGSTSVIEQVAARDSRFVLVREPAQGVHHALNAGIARAAGDIVLLLDGDDLYRPDRVARTVSCFEATGAALVACNGQRATGAGQLEEMFEPYFYSVASLPALACQYNPIWTVSFLALTRAALRGIGPLPECYGRILDWHLFLAANEQGLRVALLDEPLVVKRYDGRNLANDVEVTERQAIPRIAAFMTRCAGALDLYGPADRRRLLTRRYLHAVEHMRRRGRWAELEGYLADQVGANGIREEVHRFAVALSWYQRSRQHFARELDACRSDHPLLLFARGLAALEGGDAPAAAGLFERAYVKTDRRFAEALNSWAIAVAPSDPRRAAALLEHLVDGRPDYRDGRLNLMHLRHGQLEHCRHTVCLRPETLHWLAEWP